MSCPKFFLLAAIIAVAATSCAAQMLATANYANGNCMGAVVEKGSAAVGKCTLTSRSLYAKASLSGTVRFAGGAVKDAHFQVAFKRMPLYSSTCLVLTTCTAACRFGLLLSFSAIAYAFHFVITMRFTTDHNYY